MGRVTGQVVGAARWTAELAAGCFVPGAPEGAPAVQLTARIATAATTSGPARFMPSLSAFEALPGRAARCFSPVTCRDSRIGALTGCEPN